VRRIAERTGPDTGLALKSARFRPQIIILSSAMLVFIFFWRAAAIVLCDLASTAYDIGGIVEQAGGKEAAWCILAVMAFAYAVRGVYIRPRPGGAPRQIGRPAGVAVE
jgi:hypothetical protein